MTLREKVRAVEKVFKQLEADQKKFKESTHLGCAPACGKCCFKPDIEATPLEFLPFAFVLFKEGKSFQWLDRLKTDRASTCMILKPFLDQGSNGMCSEYPYRGLICRLFGFSGRLNKHGQKELVTCQIIKSEHADKIEKINEQIVSDLKIPLMNNYYMKMHAIDPELSRQFFPINVAIKKAIEIVLHYYTYRTRRTA